MLKLSIPPQLSVEFATVEALWMSKAETRRVDALILSWVKYEKQLRRLLTFLVFQHEQLTAETVEDVIAAFAEKRDLYPETLISGIHELGVATLPDLLGEAYKELWPEIKRIKKYRNKIMHGQLTGQGISSHRLEKDVGILVAWIAALASGAERILGYDGIKRKTFVHAKGTANILLGSYPFQNAKGLKEWLAGLKRYEG